MSRTLPRIVLPRRNKCVKGIAKGRLAAMADTLSYARDGSRKLRRVKKTILIYGLLGGALIALMRLVEYRFLVVQHSLEIYGGIVALIFAALGIWLGLKLTRTRVVVQEVPVPVPARPFVLNTATQQKLGITPRELEILQLIAAGLSNREIAAKLYVSENTVKTHAGSVFEKLAAKRRTQAVQMAKEQGLIP